MRKLVSKKTRGSGQLDGVNRMILRSLVLTRHQRVTDGQTDGRTHRLTDELVTYS